jgi:serine/threonine protein kinase
MKAERWAQIDRLLDEALALPPDERGNFLARLARDDEELRQEVASLLAAHERAAGAFLQAPALEVAARQFAEGQSTSLIGAELGPYQILAVLGVGGMGEVYLAQDARLKRRLALKLLPRQFVADAARVERFAREARAVSALNHPNIVTVYDIGEANGRHYIAMEYVDGQTLREKCRAGPSGVKEAVEIVRQIAAALSAAHEAGIVHRDIKPENIMLRRDGYVKVLDFGLAKLTERQRSAGETQASARDLAKTNPGAVLGTVRYMSPEQALGEEVDQRSDIFSLGVLLYELVTGVLPFKGHSTANLLDAIVHHQPLPLTQVRSDAPAELERIVNRMLEKDRDLRYQTAGDLRAVLKRLQIELDLSPSPSTISASDAAPLPQARSGAMKLSLGVVLMALLAAIGFAAWRYLPGLNKPSPWSDAFSTAITDTTEEELFPSLAPDGKSIVYARSRNNHWDIYWQRVGGSNAQNLTEGAPGNSTQPAFSPNGEQIAFYSDREGGGIFVMGASGESVRRLSDVGGYFHPAWSPDSKEVIYTEENVQNPRDRAVRPRKVWSVNVATLERRVISMEDISQPQWSPNGYRLAYWTTTKGGQRDIWTMPARGGASVRVTNDEATDWNPVWSPDGQHLYFASDRSGGMRLWRVAIDERSGQALGVPELVPTPSAYSQHISFSRDGKRLAFAQTVTRYAIERRAFDPARGQVTGQPLPLVQNTKGADDPHLSPDGAVIVYSSVEGNREEIYSLKSDGTGQPQQLTSDPSKKRSPRWSPDGRRIAFYCDRSGAWEIWTINADGTGLQQLTFTGGSAAFYPLWSPESTRLIYTTRSATPTLIEVTKPWSQQTPQAVLPLTDPPQIFWPRDWSPDGKKLAGGWREAINKPRYLVAFDLTTRQIERLLDSGSEQVAWLNDSRRLIFQQEGRTMLLDTQTRKTYEVFYNPPHKAFNYTLSRDNRWLYYSLQTADADIWLLSRE